MTRMAIVAAAAALVSPLLVIPAVASADTGDLRGPEQGDWELTLSGNGASDNDFETNTLGVSGSIGKYLTDNVLLGARQSVNWADIGDGSDDLVSGSTRGFADYVFDLGAFRPYLGVSVGALYGDGVNDSLAAGPQVGFKYYADENTFIFAQTEYQFAFDSPADADEAFDDGGFNHAIGVGFNF